MPTPSWTVSFTMPTASNSPAKACAGHEANRTRRLDPPPPPVTQSHRPARLATRAASFRYGGRHHSGIPGDIIPLYPGGFVGIRKDLSPERRLDATNEYLKQDPGRVQLAGLFGSNGRSIAGNLESLPGVLKTDNAVQSAVVDRIDETGREKQAVRLIARSLPSGDVLVIGRNVDEVGEIARVVGRALALGLGPAV